MSERLAWLHGTVLLVLWGLAVADAAQILGRSVLQLPDGRFRADRVEVASRGPTYLRLRGVQYAEHPVGQLRWRPPLRRLWTNTSVVDATQWGPDCVQGAAWYEKVVFIGLFTRTSEGCLYLNVWAPEQLGTGGELLPVMFWIHGGSFRAGGSSQYSADDLMEQRRGAIYVTVNYRLGALGFLGGAAVARSSGDSSQGNFGLQDTREALLWVRRNIRALGGDPERITIFGESAGASLVAVHMVAPRSFGLFSAALMESGPFDNYTTQTDPEDSFKQFATHAGCLKANSSAADDDKALDCLRALPLTTFCPWRTQLLDAVQVVAQAGLFSPVIDGVELQATTEVLAAQGRLAPVKGVLLGTNADEGRLLMPQDTPVPGAPFSTEAQFKQWLSNQWPQDVDAILQRYPGTKYEGSPHRWWLTAADVYTHSEYTCPTRRSARWLLQSGKVEAGNVFVYKMTYEPAYAVKQGNFFYWLFWCSDTILPCKAMKTRFGAAHGVELPLVWGETEKFKNATDAALSRKVVAWWQQFAEMSAPGTVDSVAWPAFGSKNETMLLDANPDSVVDPIPQLCDFWDQLHPVPYSRARSSSARDAPHRGPAALIV